MPGVNKTQVEQAKQIDLLAYLQREEPGALRKTGPSEYCLKEHDSLKISNGKWHWFSQNIGGRTALDFLIKVRNIPFVEAVRQLCERTPDLPSQPVISRARTPTSAAPFMLPPRNGENARVITYLIRRGIDREIIDHCVRANTLYESAGTHNCVFVGQDETGKPRFACIRGTSGDFKLDVESSDKRFGFRLSPPSPSRFVMVFESPIDALSMVTLRKLHNEDWQHAHYLALGGTSPLAFLRFINAHLEADHVTLCLDNDRAGMDGMAKIRAEIQSDAVLSRCIREITDRPPPIGKDWNEAIQTMLHQKRAYSEPSRPYDRAAVLR